MIYLSDDYIIGFDSLNIKLYERLNGKTSKAIEYNGSYYRCNYYFSDFSTLLRYLVKLKIFSLRDSIKTLNQILDEIEKFKDCILKKIEIINTKKEL